MGLQLSKAEDKENIVAEEHDDDAHHHDDHGDEDKGPQTCREKLREFLHTQKFQITIIVLVVLDCALVIGELVLDYEAVANAKCPTEVQPTDGNVTSDHAEVEAEAEVQASEGEHNLTPTQKAAEALHYLSLIILSIFMVELMLKLIALGTKFFHSKLEVFDAIIIIVSFILDIITLLFPENFAIVDLIVVLRLWRIVRVVNGVVLSVEQRAEKRINHHKRVRDRAIMAAMKFEKYSAALEEEIQILRDLLGTNGVKLDETLFKSRPEKPHYDRKYHMTTENGEDGDHHHHHLHLPFHHRKKHAQPETNDSSAALHLDDSKPPDYDALHQGNHEENC
ncbi:voltage-gated hydrogen channel 1-like isoform X2 [Patiria miniata]|nr:voltage-gated hydrogen channel 1-like isoform X2 [Patiria miniata]XP_038056026.1 voltage-gated hydrogen channel 1-like isoform X2 [Patiria miniata]